MKIVKMVAVGLFISLFIGCGTKSENSNEEPQGVIPEQQLRALEKAKSVEQALLDAEEKRKKAMKEQGI